MSSGLKGMKLNYPEVDKKAYVIYKVVKHYRTQLLNCRTKIIVPYIVVKNLLVQKQLGEKRAHWMTVLQEYDLEINPSNIVRGQGLRQLVTQSVESQKEKYEWINEAYYVED